MDIAAVVELDPYRAFNFGTGNNGVTGDLADLGEGSGSAFANVELGSGDNILGANFNFGLYNGSFNIVSGNNVDNNELDFFFSIGAECIGGADLNALDNSVVGLTIGVLAISSDALVNDLPIGDQFLIISHGIVDDVGDTNLLADLNGDGVFKDGDAGLVARSVLILHVEAEELTGVAIREAEQEGAMLGGEFTSGRNLFSIYSLANKSVKIYIVLVVVFKNLNKILGLSSSQSIPMIVTNLPIEIIHASDPSKILDAGEGHIEAAVSIEEIRGDALNGNKLVRSTEVHVLVGFAHEGNNSTLRIGETGLIKSANLNSHGIVGSTNDSLTAGLVHSSNVELEGAGYIVPGAISVLLPSSLIEGCAEVVLLRAIVAHNGQSGNTSVLNGINIIFEVIPFYLYQSALRVSIGDPELEILIVSGQRNSQIYYFISSIGIGVIVTSFAVDQSFFGDSVSGASYNFAQNLDLNRNLDSGANSAALCMLGVIERLKFAVVTFKSNSVGAILLNTGLIISAIEFASIVFFPSNTDTFSKNLAGDRISDRADLTRIGSYTGLNSLLSIPTSILDVNARPSVGEGLVASCSISYRNQAD